MPVLFFSLFSERIGKPPTTAVPSDIALAILHKMLKIMCVRKRERERERERERQRKREMEIKRERERERGRERERKRERETV